MMISSLIHFFATPSTTQQPNNDDNKQIHRRSFSANLILLLGYIFAVWFQIYQFHMRDREIIAITVYFSAFSLLVFSGMLELSVDIFSFRTVGHGRYSCYSPTWNRIISLFFIAMGLMDIVAFCFWMQLDFDTEDVVLICSGYLLLIMTILVLVFQIKDSIDGTPDRIDLVANGLMFVFAILNVVQKHFAHYRSTTYSVDMMTERMELAVVILFLITAVMYVSADLIRIYSSWSTKLQSTQSLTPTQ
jgi:hypothetical protein